MGLREFVCPPANKGVPATAIIPAVEPSTGPLTLFDPATDMEKLDRSRVDRQTSNQRNGARGSQTLRLMLPRSTGRTSQDVTASLYIGDRVAKRGQGILQAKSVSVAAATEVDEAILFVTLVEKDGSAWGSEVKVSAAGTAVTLPLSEMKSVEWVMLPQGYPGDWSYWAQPTSRSGGMSLREVERLQLSVRNADHTGTASAEPPAPAEIVIHRVTLV